MVAREGDSNTPAMRIESVLKAQTNWENLWFYQKTVVLFQLTYAFTRRFLPSFGDRTVDQMQQAARSGKQNIVEGIADGITSTEMEIKMLNVARGSVQELREDYIDYIISRGRTLWTAAHGRYDKLLDYCRNHNKLEHYMPFFDKWNDEEMANCAITLCHMVDKMMMSYQKRVEQEFVENGGIRERMTAARLKKRAFQKAELDKADELINQLKNENQQLKETIKQLECRIQQLENSG